MKALGEWSVQVDPAGEPADNMIRDEQLARQVRGAEGAPTLRIYGWARPAVSLGRRQNADDLPRVLRDGKLPMVRRPTGGGAVIHRLDELTYALAVSRMPAGLIPRQIPGMLHRYLREELVQRGLFSAGDLSLQTPAAFAASSSAHFCFDSPVCGDLLYRHRKVAGSALRVWREALLIQGSVQGLPVERLTLGSLLAAAVRRLFGA